ncbi:MULTISPECIES: prepilin-type N-terminal cleavage/methylation domain-containing protein [Anaeromyxobacter]|uniref:prepilin-type N-terminal cleavage/methylation domain-containing protein n=1 Tax=Anaeromyxobacter TaxID=161492 RepID=UPI001F56294A|nr:MULTISPECIES: prepilin-type N-terminal cleavage/methylation domain-containing protein [unclassified Anaeromyxobacter]
MTRRAARRGFTLLEVMIALAILAAALLTVSEIVGGSLRNHVRARQLEVATLLARGKMVELESEYERKGFRDFDESAEGTFEDAGHPEVRWSTEVVKPQVELSAERILQMLTGGEGALEDLLAAAAPQAGKGGPKTVGPGAGALAQGLQAPITQLGEQIKKGVREVRLKVAWKDGKRDESFTVVTHMVVLAPREPGA